MTILSAPDETIFPTSLGPEYISFDHIHWYVGNAKQAASYYITRMGFKPLAYRGPETGSHCLASYVIANGEAVFILTGPVCGPARADAENKALQRATCEERAALAAVHEHLTVHGDGVKDVAFRITGDVDAVWRRAIKNGAAAVDGPKIVQADCGGDGYIMTATVGTYGDTVHSLVNREHYARDAPFLPGYRVVDGDDDPINQILPPVEFLEIDHCVGNQSWGGVDQVVQFYEECLDFHRYWTVDDKAMCSEYSAMRSIVVASPNETIKMPMNEPANGKKKSQIEEYVDYYHGAGVQHIAFRSHDIVSAVTHLQARGVQFLQVPSAYYTDLRQRLSHVSWTLDADVAVLEKLNILVDFDERGYLLQIFAKHVGDRPTVFVEVIQRHGFDGFGAGNFKSLFEAFEREQALRGNL
ncbi:4-hydroxyphenylpyruvate dioxygenase [Penicillium canariense]|uniref:4-hydroxyphenylpyruvate dioxygenase n=1 Tax=Penicillium canariense TaxID=189055 RepID=A0A9W9LJJ8_9EURO|nr:4-hydroxyphenylpyruvate dioxygenase [Penicillium canariense]KAJ5160832.1 4-hydroxyphenylpyruvate dioxygenase [Penicillium canariense]